MASPKSLFLAGVNPGETYRSATRPMLFDVINQVLDYFGINGAKILINGEAEVPKLLGSNGDDKKSTDLGTDLKLTDKVYVIAEIEPGEFNTGFASSPLMGMTPAVWKDDSIGLHIAPIYRGRVVSMDMNKHFITRQDAVNFINSIETVLDQQVGPFSVDINIHHPLPEGIIQLISECHGLLAKADATDLKFNDYFYKNAKAPMHYVTNPIGNNPMIVVSRRIEGTEILYNAPFIARTKKASDQLGKWEVSFRFQFHWQEHVRWDVHYPAMIYQQPLDNKWMPTVSEKVSRDATDNTFFDLAFMNAILKKKLQHLPYYHKFPDFDVWTPPQEDWRSATIQAMLVLKDVEEQLVCDFNELPNFKWDLRYLAFIKKYHHRMLKLNSSVMHIRLYSDDIPVDIEGLEFTIEGKLILKRPPTMANTHRAVLFFNYDLNSLDADARADMGLNPDDFNWLLPGMFPWIDIPDLSNMDDKGIKDFLNDSRWGSDMYYNRPFPNGMMAMSIIPMNEQGYYR